MSRLQTLRMIACMLLMGVVAIAAYLFYQHSLYFCLFFSLMIMAGIIIYICQWQYKTTRMISRMIEGIRYADFSLSFSTQHKTRTEQRLAQDVYKRQMCIHRQFPMDIPYYDDAACQTEC